jgi:hypothetical protein
MLAGKKVKRILNYEQKLGYFALTFGLDIDYGIDREGAAAPKKAPLLRLVELCRNENELFGAIVVSPGYLKTDADPKELVSEGAQWYETRMRRNLKSLADVMK